MMCKSIVAGLAAAMLFAGAAQAADRLCKGTAEDEASGASVDVVFRVDDKGTVKAREASWSLASPAGGLGILTGEPNVSVDYDAPTEQGIGPASRIGAFSMVMTNDGRFFADASAVFDLPDGRNWRDADPVFATGTGRDGAVTMVMAIGDWTPQTAPDLFADLELAGQARASFRRGDAILKVTTVDFRGRTERDKLFQQAWAAAVKAAEQPRRCEKAK